MTVIPFRAELRQMGRVTTIDLHGEMNSNAQAGLAAAYEQAQRSDPEVIALNFSPVGYINSTGIALIVDLLARTRQAHRRLVAFGLSDHYREIFQITRLADFITIYPDEVAAMAELTGRVKA